MLTYRRVAVVGSREFQNYSQLDRTLQQVVKPGDRLVSGGAVGVDSMAQRWAKDNGHTILVIYPDRKRLGRRATFARDKVIAEESDIVLAFYRKGHFQEGGTADTAMWARKLERSLLEYQEEGE